MQIQMEMQLRRVEDEVSATTAVVRPILFGLLYALKKDVVQQFNGHENLTLAMLARVYRPGDGDCGLCFEYAVHDAMNRQEGTVTERVADALERHCGLKGQSPASILFGAEKDGSLNLIDTAHSILTDESQLLYGSRGRPAKLKRHIDSISAALRRQDVRQQLPASISGLWKADLFLGQSDADRWVGTTVKINQSKLEGAKGLRVGIVPSREGTSDKIYQDDNKNLIVCPMPYDGAFMETFYQGWQVVQQFIHADAKVPSEVALPRPADRQVARYLADRRNFPVLDVIDALDPLAQPELLERQDRDADIFQRKSGPNRVNYILSPFPNNLATKPAQAVDPAKPGSGNEN